MLDAETFGRELAEMVKAQMLPLLSRMEALEKRLDDIPEPEPAKVMLDEAASSRADARSRQGRS